MNFEGMKNSTSSWGPSTTYQNFNYEALDLLYRIFLDFLTLQTPGRNLYKALSKINLRTEEYGEYCSYLTASLNIIIKINDIHLSFAHQDTNYHPLPAASSTTTDYSHSTTILTPTVNMSPSSKLNNMFDSPAFTSCSTLDTQSTSTPSQRPLTPPIITLPPRLGTPEGLDLRIQPQTPEFVRLDAELSRSSHSSNRSTPHLDEALNRLEKHITNRLPYAQFASMRLHAATGIRNESIFDLPELQRFNPAPALIRGPFVSSSTRLSATSISAMNRRKDSGISLYAGVLGEAAGMHVVNKETGKGLREFLLLKGSEYGFRKLECKSVSFHDTTPEISSGEFRNVLLGHYAKTASTDRVDLYEVDL
jgi:hypothetical protein